MRGTVAILLLALASSLSGQIRVPRLHDMVWDAARSRMYVSAGTDILRIDPETAQVEATIPLSEAGVRLAVTPDGRSVYAALGSRIERWNADSLTRDLTIEGLTATSLAALGGGAILVGSAQGLTVYDEASPRAESIRGQISSLYVRPGDGAVFALVPGRVWRLRVSASGVGIIEKTALGRAFDPRSVWSGRLLLDRQGSVFDLEERVTVASAGADGACGLIPGYDGKSAILAKRSSIVRYSIERFQPVATAPIEPAGICDSAYLVTLWGEEGFAFAISEGANPGTALYFVRPGEWSPVTLQPAPEPGTDGAALRIGITAADLAYDRARNLVWVSVAGMADREIGNRVVSLDPASGRVVDILATVDMPQKLSISEDGKRLYVMSGSTPRVGVVDLENKTLLRVFSTLEGTDVYWSPVFLLAVPGSSDSVVVVRRPYEVSYATAIQIYRDGEALPRFWSNYVPGSAFGDMKQPPFSAVYPGDSPDSLYAVDLDLHYGDGSHAIGRLTFDERGIGVDKVLGSVPLGDTSYFGVRAGNIVYHEGRLYTSGGVILHAVTGAPLGVFGVEQSYASSSVPLLFPERNQIVYVYRSIYATGAVTAFETTTQRPVASVPITYNFEWLKCAVRAGSNAVAAAIGARVMIYSLDRAPEWPQPSLTWSDAGKGLRLLDLRVTDLSSLPGTSKLALALPSRVGRLGNSVAIFEPESARVESSTFMGSEPRMLRPARDGSVVYTYLGGESVIARLDMRARTRDLVFAADPKGTSAPTPITDMAVAPDHGLVVNINAGWLAVFDDGAMRPSLDRNTEGPGAFGPGTTKICLNDAGDMLYAYNDEWSGFEFKRDRVTASGVEFLSGARELLFGYGVDLQCAGGLVFGSNGQVADPEKSRIVARMPATAVAPDLAARRIYTATGGDYDGSILVFDATTYAMIGRLDFAVRGFRPKSVVRYGADGLAILTDDGRLYSIRTSAIPQLAAPVTGAARTLPATPGVHVVDIAVSDLAWDPVRRRLYGSTPNSEAAMGDRIVAIDPSAGAVVESWPTGARNPGLLATSTDQTRLYFTSGGEELRYYSSFSTKPQTVRYLSLDSSTLSVPFPHYAANSTTSYVFTDLLPVDGQAGAVVTSGTRTRIVDSPTGVILEWTFDGVKVYDEDQPRAKSVTAECTRLAAGASPERLYCWSGVGAVSVLGVDGEGVRMLRQIPVPAPEAQQGPMAFRNGRLYTTSGVVLEPESDRVVANTEARGQVAVDERFVYWLDSRWWTAQTPELLLRVFDVRTLEPVRTRPIRASSGYVTRLVGCGDGCLAFGAGYEVYLVRGD